MQLIDPLVLWSHHLTDYDWTPLSQDPRCLRSGRRAYRFCMHEISSLLVRLLASLQIDRRLSIYEIYIGLKSWIDDPNAIGCRIWREWPLCCDPLKLIPCFLIFTALATDRIHLTTLKQNAFGIIFGAIFGTNCALRFVRFMGAQCHYQGPPFLHE